MKPEQEDCCSSPSLISVDEAISKITSPVTSITQTESVAIINAIGRVISEDIHSNINVPGYDNSAMDGYAVNSRDCNSEGVTLSVSQRIPAGKVGQPLEAGTAARIFTGAPIPENADAVVMQELCEADDNRVRINTIVHSGSNVRKAGEDIRKDSVVLTTGHLVRPQEMGLLASIGCATVPVFRKLKVAIFFTGDELIEPGAKPGPGQIYNSNKYTLNGLLNKCGCEVIDLGIVPDTLEATVDVLRLAAAQADLVITSGGVSVGEEDYVRLALEKLGKLTMWRIAMKPGKPVAYGNVDKAIFMGLPGNPVSVFVTFLIFARPLILKMQGAKNYLNKFSLVKAGFDWQGGKRQEYVRVKIEQTDNGPTAKLFPHQGSGVLSSACWADGLVEVPVDTDITQGDMVNYLYF